jgi:hypothetical protein
MYLREKPLKDHSIVICFFGKWSVERKNMRCIDHHSISDLKENLKKKLLATCMKTKHKMKLERKS